MRKAIVNIIKRFGINFGLNNDRVAKISHRQEFSIKRSEEFANRILDELGIKS